MKIDESKSEGKLVADNIRLRSALRTAYGYFIQWGDHVRPEGTMNNLYERDHKKIIRALRGIE